MDPSADQNERTPEVMKTVAPECVTARDVGKPISVLAVNKTPDIWLSYVCRPRAYWVKGGCRIDGPVTTDDHLPLDAFPGCPVSLCVLVPKFPVRERPSALRIVVLENGAGEHVICDIPFR